MIALWLDDLREMPASFDVHVRTVEEAISLLRTGNVGSISFDHDLGTKLSGYDLATWIETEAEAGRLGRVVWAVHSSNAPGRQAIIAAMNSAERFWSQ